jgi:hypothetical protein
MRIAYPIHHSQDLSCEDTFSQVILEHEGSTSHAACLAEQDVRIVGVMQDVNEHHNVHAFIGVWNVVSIEAGCRDSTARSRQDINALDATVRFAVRKLTGKQSIAASNIQYGRACWQHWCKDSPE